MLSVEQRHDGTDEPSHSRHNHSQRRYALTKGRVQKTQQERYT